MKLKDMSKTELEAMSFTDLTDILLKEEKKPINTPRLFRMICDLLEYSEEAYESNIGDYYTSLTTDKRFLLLESGEWDLKDRHAVKIVLEDDSEEEEEYLEEEEEIIEETEEDDLEPMLDDTDDLTDEDDDIEDLAIIDEEEMDEE